MDSITRLPFSFAFQMGLAKGKQQQGIGRWKEKGGGMYSPYPHPTFAWLQFWQWLFSVVTASVQPLLF